VSRRRKVVSASLITLGGLWLYLSPYIAIRSLREVAAAGDAVALAERVDFPAVRESLRQSVAARVSGQVGGGKEGTLLGAIGASLAMALMGPVIDAMVTPEGVLALMNGETPRGEDADPSQRVQEEDAAQTTIRYRDLNHFVLSVVKDDSSDAPVELVFRRENLFWWKLIGVRVDR